MDRSLELSLLDECLELAQANKPFMAESDVRVDVREYLDEARYGRELEHVFRELPNLVAVERSATCVAITRLPDPVADTERSALSSTRMRVASSTPPRPTSIPRP